MITPFKSFKTDKKNTSIGPTELSLQNLGQIGPAVLLQMRQHTDRQRLHLYLHNLERLLSNIYLIIDLYCSFFFLLMFTSEDRFGVFLDRSDLIFFQFDIWEWGPNEMLVLLGNTKCIPCF